MPISPLSLVIALNRMTFGATNELIEQTRGRFESFVDSQLHPPKEEDAIVMGKIAATNLHIKYDAKEERYAAVDEDRSLGLWDSPDRNTLAIDKL